MSLQTILALDPSLSATGVAAFVDGVLTHAATIELRTRGDISSRVQRMATAVAAWAVGKVRPSAVVVEWPQIYRAGKSKGDPNDITPLAGICAAVAARIELDGALAPLDGREVDFVSYTPREWTGTIPKDTTVKGAKTSARALRIQSRLAGPELDIWDTVISDDTIDAIGIGLKYLGRFERRRVFGR